MLKPIIFCDFDGTITKTDNIVDIMERFAPPEAITIKDDIFTQRISVKDGIEALFNLLSSDLKEDIIQFVLEKAIIRDGFKEFVEYAREQEIPFYVVSGGIAFFLEPRLAEFGSFDGIYCNDADFSHDSIQITYPNPCDEYCTNQQCGCCKPTIIRTLAQKGQTVIVIGDSVTDFEAAKIADLVIARDLLLKRCQNQNLPHQPFETFNDCLNILKNLMTTEQQ